MTDITWGDMVNAMNSVPEIPKPIDILFLTTQQWILLSGFFEEFGTSNQVPHTMFGMEIRPVPSAVLKQRMLEALFHGKKVAYVDQCGEVQVCEDDSFVGERDLLTQSMSKLRNLPQQNLFGTVEDSAKPIDRNPGSIR